MTIIRKKPKCPLYLESFKLPTKSRIYKKILNQAKILTVFTVIFILIFYNFNVTTFSSNRLSSKVTFSSFID